MAHGSDGMVRGPVPVRVTGGRLPTLWPDRSVLFVANLHALFYGDEEEMNALLDGIPNSDSYGARILPVLGLMFGGPDTTLVLERPGDPDLLAYFSSVLGLRMPIIEVWERSDYCAAVRAMRAGVAPPHPEIPARLARSGAAWVDGWVTDSDLTTLAAWLDRPTVSTAEGSRRGNNKRLLHEALVAAGLPVFPTEIVADPAGLPSAFRRLAAAGHRQVVVKAALGASGVGLRRFGVDDPDLRLPPYFFSEGPALVQAWIAADGRDVGAIHSPSVQIFVGDGGIDLFDLTEQILSHESVHEGNESPPAYLGRHHGLEGELYGQAGVAARWLHGQGYRGMGSVDFLVAVPAGGGTARVYVCEVNARVTGATYPSLLARHLLPGGCWRMQNIPLVRPLSSAALLDQLERHGDLFRPGDGAGILPLNLNPGPDGLIRKGQFLFLGPTGQVCREMQMRAGADLPVRSPAGDDPR